MSSLVSVLKLSPKVSETLAHKQMLDEYGYDTMQVLIFMATLFVFVVGLGVLVIIIVFIRDISQKKDAIRRNYPVIGRFRYLFGSLGEFFRQYFFAMDREEMPFNRAEREWVYKSSSGFDNTVAFGSTKNLTPTGTALIAHSCGVPHQRALTRAHCRLVQPDGKSVLMSTLYPKPEVLSDYRQ